jgi:two-component system cell cycle sensor histidine kinase/response regulator CckA
MQPPTNPSSQRILVVDDNPAIHEDFRKILCPVRSQAGSDLADLAADLFGDAAPEAPGAVFEMDSAFQGQEALARVKAAEAEGRPYSLAFMDVRMPPGWDGIETIARIWKEHPAIQVVICTAYSDYSWEEILRKLGESDSLVILKKPFDNVEVLQLAHTLTKKWAMTRQASARLADLDEAVKRRAHELLEANQQLQHEIQRRSLIEKALRESEERFHKSFESAAVGLAILRAEDRRFLDVNQNFIQLTGRTKEELIGRTSAELELFPEQGKPQEIVASMQAAQKIQNIELVIRRKDGQVRQALLSVDQLSLGQQPCWLAVLLDVTSQRELEGQLRQAQKMEAVGQLAAGVAHDFNNLLTVIHGYSSLQLAKANLDADIAKAFKQVRLASERASALTRQLLAFSRKQVVQRRRLSLGQTLANLQKMLIRMVGETIQIQCHAPADLPFIMADESNLEQVIMNLVLNSRDAMPGGGIIRLAAGPCSVSPLESVSHPDRHPGHYVVLTVSDTGCGMDEATLARIFEPFFTTKPIGKGTGLGLSTAYGIVKQHEGWIEVQSRSGAGTTFSIFLPVAQEVSLAKQPELPINLVPARPDGRGQPTIFVVEDEPAVREYVVAVLNAEGFLVEQAGSGAEALSRWKGSVGQIDLLITDMVMPDGVNGSLLARRLLHLDPSLKVLYISGYSPDVIAHGESLTEGLNFLAKPFAPEQLLTAVRKALETRAPAVELVPVES